MAKKKTDDVKKVSLNIYNGKGLVDFLSKFKSIDTNILLTITPEVLEVRTTTPGDNAFKVGEINFEDIFTIPEGEILPDELNIGIFHIEKFTKIFSYISDDAITLNVTYKQEDGFSIKNEIKTATLNKVFPSAGRNVFRTLTDEQLERAFDTEEALLKIDFDKILLEKINNLLSLETSKFFSITYKKGVLSFVGKEFKLRYSGDIEVINDEEFEIPFEKNIFKFADKDDYGMYVKDTGLLLFSDGFKIGLAAADEQMETDTESDD